MNPTLKPTLEVRVRDEQASGAAGAGIQAGGAPALVKEAAPVVLAGEALAAVTPFPRVSHRPASTPAPSEIRQLQWRAEAIQLQLRSLNATTRYWGPDQLEERHDLERLSEQAVGRLERAKTQTPELQAMLAEVDAAMVVASPAESATRIVALVEGSRRSELLNERVTVHVAEWIGEWIARHGSPEGSKAPLLDMMRSIRDNGPWSPHFQMTEYGDHVGYLAYKLLKGREVVAGTAGEDLLDRAHTSLID